MQSQRCTNIRRGERPLQEVLHVHTTHGHTNLAGDLVAILDEQEFGEVDTSCLGLTPLNVEERVGIIWGSITPKRDLHLNEYLAGYDEYLESHDLANCHLVGQQTIEGPNWKVAYDGYPELLPSPHTS